ncbi:hypothetical protein [Crocinitomix catalasitica]|uniref:hypothetical protein n=1 Tax=Crocinitomix catalasitica TaxID=184607 RepID=UPI00048398B8|nr:hypothetical protein [Crocinitomix catalasitica]
MKIIVILLVVVAIGGLFVRYAKNKNAKKRKFYKDFGIRHGLVYSEVKGFLTVMSTLKGPVKGVDVLIKEQISGKGKGSYVAIEIIIDIPESDFNFTISREDILSKVGSVLGYKDIQIGVEAIDKKFHFMSDDEVKFKAILNYNLQQELKSILKNLNGTIQLKDKRFIYKMRSEWFNQKKWDELDRVLKFMMIIAREIKL